MIFLITIWAISIVALAFTLISAFRGVVSVHSEKYLSKGLPASSLDLYIITYKDISRVITDRWHDILPSIHNAVTYILMRIISNRDRLYAKVFGYPAVPQGGVVSFFLKRIIVHKEEFKIKVAKRRSLHDEMPTQKHRNYLADLKKGE